MSGANPQSSQVATGANTGTIKGSSYMINKENKPNNASSSTSATNKSNQNKAMVFGMVQQQQQAHNQSQSQ